MSAPQPASSPERPLSGAAKLALAGAAGGTILLFYLYAAVSILTLLVLLGTELLFVVVLARFGLAGTMAKTMAEHVAPLPVFLRCFWLRKRTEFQLTLQPEEAPGLFAILQTLCQRVKVALPTEVALEMNVNAWVRLKGYRRGAGRTVLGVGYDLLAGLTQAEAEAVLAHEMVHAKLVQRGFKWWLGGGLGRAVQLANGLAAQAEAARRNRQPLGTTEGFLSWADWLARTSARLVAAWSRQDEFAADQGAAQLCGAAAMRSALVKVEAAGHNAQRLPWRERVAQLQLGEGFSQWLVKELSAERAAQSSPTDPAPFNKYSTHPSLPDRLAALGPDTAPGLGDSPSALGLLAKPDEVAEKLMAEIQRTVAQEEAKDTVRLNRWSRKINAGSGVRPLQVIGILLAAVGLIVALILGFTDGLSLGLGEFVALTVVPGILCYRFGGYRERLALPVPDYAVLKAAWQQTLTDLPAKAKTLETELRAHVARESKPRRKAGLLLQEAYTALGRCDYLRAHVAARLCVEQDKKSAEGLLGFAVAAAALGQTQQVSWALQTLRTLAPLSGTSGSWGAGWALSLCGDWVHAEAFLQRAHKRQPAEPTVLALLAICQVRRGKLHSALASARQACAPAPRNKEYAKLLIDLLLDGGFLREAQQHLPRWESEANQDTDLRLSMVRLNLMRRNLEAADAWAKPLRSNGAQTLVRLGGIYEAARRGEPAAAYYEQALEAGYYPEARLGLGRLETQRNNKPQAQLHFLAALDLQRTPGEGAVAALQVFPQALQHLLMLQEPVLHCKAWLAAFNHDVLPALAGKTFRICAPSYSEAERYLRTVLEALQPGPSPIHPSRIGWREAPKEQQPDGPVRPGIQAVF